MDINVFGSKRELGERAAADGAERLRRAIDERGRACIVLATGASQIETLDALVAADGIDWTKVVGFHLDEYIDLPMSHPASFRRYLKERFVDRVPLELFHYINGEVPTDEELRRLNEEIADYPIDVCFCGIGENAHLAFNDPPADFETTEPYIPVALDEACRRQQLGEGWFEQLADVPDSAISMSVRHMLTAKRIVCSVPDERKAEAVQSAVEGELTPDVPASILREHRSVGLYLDQQSAAGLADFG